MPFEPTMTIELQFNYSLLLTRSSAGDVRESEIAPFLLSGNNNKKNRSSNRLEKYQLSLLPLYEILEPTTRMTSGF